MTVGVEPRTIEYDIDALAKQFALPLTAAHTLLWAEIHHLEHLARIHDFIPLLALKHVKERLRERPFSDLLYGLA
ncbi:MAG: DUF3562 domain-containing protein [Nitrospira sp.]|nr:DUF3562 domain-containing protein [Nitrospira sp.]